MIASKFVDIRCNSEENKKNAQAWTEFEPNCIKIRSDAIYYFQLCKNPPSRNELFRSNITENYERVTLNSPWLTIVTNW